MKFKNFREFYPTYLKEHDNLMCRRFHFIGTCIVLSLILLLFFTGNFFILSVVPVAGYGFAWFGHFMFEKNRPMTFIHPYYSLLGDFKMFWDILTGKLQAF
jgi:hypothetical protein